MTETRREYINEPEADLGRVEFCRVGRWDGDDLVSVEGFEVSFRESAPEMRNRFLWWMLFFAIVATFIPFILVLEPVSTLIWVFGWDELDASAKQFGLTVLAAGAPCPVLWWLALPPFRSKVFVEVSCPQNRVAIHHGGALARELRLAWVRGVTIEPHPKAREWQIKAQLDPNWGNRRQAAIFSQVETIFLQVGRLGATEYRVEVASIMERPGGRAQTASRARAALDAAISLGQQFMREPALPSPAEPVEEPAGLPAPAPPAPAPKRRRRRGRIE